MSAGPRDVKHVCEKSGGAQRWLSVSGMRPASSLFSFLLHFLCFLRRQLLLLCLVSSVVVHGGCGVAGIGVCKCVIQWLCVILVVVLLLVLVLMCASVAGCGVGLAEQ